jgi:hypothetical protein
VELPVQPRPVRRVADVVDGDRLVLARRRGGGRLGSRARRRLGRGRRRRGRGRGRGDVAAAAAAGQGQREQGAGCGAAGGAGHGGSSGRRGTRGGQVHARPMVLHHTGPRGEAVAIVVGR